jgi:hypothetical protein
VAGHLIECGAQVTGGLAQDWEDLRLAEVGYPIAEIAADGSTVITKPDATGGRVSRETVIEQLLYEIGDPAHYLTPDVDVDFRELRVAECGADRVRVWGARGGPAPASYKVSLAYRDGFHAAGELLVYGEDCLAKAQACGQIVLDRLAAAGAAPRRAAIELLGTGQAAGRPATPRGQREVVLRIAVHDPSRAVVERFAKELAPLATSGPPGLAGYAALRPTVRPVYAYWPTSICRDRLRPEVLVRPARQWAADAPAEGGTS